MNVSGSSSRSTSSKTVCKQKTRITTKSNVASVSKSPLYVDDTTLNAMMANLETFGHGLGHFSPQRPAESERVSSTPRRRMPAMDLDEAEDSRLLLSPIKQDAEEVDEDVSYKRQESIMQWFDRSVEIELGKRKDTSMNTTKNSTLLEMIETARADTSKSPPPSPMFTRGLADATANEIEILGDLLHERDNELIDAVEKLATAEAMCNFAGAVEAAEEAVKAVPADFAEEAAAAGVRGYQREITKIVQQTLPGEHPIEVVGYIGVTKPKVPKKSSY